MAEKKLIWEFSFFLLPNKTEWGLVYCPETLCLHSAACYTHCTEKLNQQTGEIPYERGGGILTLPGSFRDSVSLGLYGLKYVYNLIMSIVYTRVYNVQCTGVCLAWLIVLCAVDCTLYNAL